MTWVDKHMEHCQSNFLCLERMMHFWPYKWPARAAHCSRLASHLASLLQRAHGWKYTTFCAGMAWATGKRWQLIHAWAWKASWRLLLLRSAARPTSLLRSSKSCQRVRSSSFYHRLLCGDQLALLAQAPHAHSMPESLRGYQDSS